MFDPESKRLFTMNDADSPDPFFWSDALPIWVTATRNKLKVATYFWPGSRVCYKLHILSSFLTFNPNRLVIHRKSEVTGPGTQNFPNLISSFSIFWPAFVFLYLKIATFDIVCSKIAHFVPFLNRFSTIWKSNENSNI